METPKTLLEAVQQFSDAENCRLFMIGVRWADGVVRCPRCDSTGVTYLQKANVYKCKTVHPKQKFSLKVGTLFEDSPIPLEKWLPAAWMISSCKNGISSYELSRSIGVTQKSAWFMLHRIRTGMGLTHDEPKMGGKGKTVQKDETIIDGDPKNWHEERREKNAKTVREPRTQVCNNTYGHKITVQGIYDKETRQVRAKVVTQRPPRHSPTADSRGHRVGFDPAYGSGRSLQELQGSVHPPDCESRRFLRQQGRDDQ